MPSAQTKGTETEITMTARRLPTSVLHLFCFFVFCLLFTGPPHGQGKSHACAHNKDLPFDMRATCATSAELCHACVRVYIHKYA